MTRHLPNTALQLCRAVIFAFVVAACGSGGSDGEGTQPAPGELVITEVLYDPEPLDDDEGEWVEIHNPTTRALELQGCVFGDASHVSEVTRSLSIPSGGYVVVGIGAPDRSAHPRPEVSWRWGAWNLGNRADEFRITCGDALVDAVGWDEALMPQLPVSGHSLSLCPEALDAGDNDDLRSWRWSLSAAGDGTWGTPGAPNEPCDPLPGLDAAHWDAGGWDAGGWDAGSRDASGGPDTLVPTDALEDTAGRDATADIGLDGGPHDDADVRYGPDFGFGTVDPALCAPGLSPGQELPDCGHAVPYPGGAVEACVVVPAGACHTTWIGSDDTVEHAMRQEQPRIEVQLTNFAVMRFPVTVRDYRACVGAGACNEPDDGRCIFAEDGFDVGETNLWDDLRLDHPVVCVNREDAIAFCGWLGGELLTEAQFEYAASGPLLGADDFRVYPWGDVFETCRANVAGDPYVTDEPDPFPGTSPVGFFDGTLRTRDEGGWPFGPDTFQTCDDSSPFGVKDLTHNVQHLVMDGPAWYEDWPAGEDGRRVDPVAPPVDPGFNVRGTGWVYHEGWHTRVFQRTPMCSNQVGRCPFDIGVPSGMSGSAVGFRCAF